MDKDIEIVDMMLAILKIYLEKNEERLNKKEKEDLINGLKKYYTTPRSNVISDKLYDFFVYLGIREPRHQTFGEEIIKKYPVENYKNVLDVGAGRVCRLSQYLEEKGYKVTAMDPDIRISKEEADEKNIKIIKEKFSCDEYSEGKEGTNIENYDLLIGLEPCDATEHIIRQCIKYNKDFEILLCASPHNSIEGKKFNTREEWYNYLKSINSKLKLEIIDGTSSYTIGNKEKIIEKSEVDHGDK